MKIDWFTFVAQVINFLVLVYLLRRFLYAPITDAMQSREQGIADRVAEASDKLVAAEAMMSDYRQRSEQLEHERHRMFEQAKLDVEASRRELLKQARHDVESRRDDWLASLNRERDTLSQLIRQRCSDQVTSATRQAIRELADADLEEQMLRSFIKKLGSDATPSAAKNHDKATAISAFEISPIWKDRLRSALTQRFRLDGVSFRVDPGVICGIEVHVGAEKIGWSAEEYLATLEEEFNRLVEHPAP